MPAGARERAPARERVGFAAGAAGNARQGLDLAGEVLVGSAGLHPEDLAAGSLYPPIGELRRVTARIAEAVVREARDSGVGRAISDEAVASEVRRAIWEPVYPALDPV